MPKKISFFEHLKIYCYIIKLTLKKQKRTYDVVSKDYDSELWNKPFETIDFESLYGNYTRDDLNEEIIGSLNDTLIKDKFQNLENQHMSQFLETFQDYKSESIVELGCGLGANLFFLKKNGFSNLEGYDLSQNAINNLKKYVKIKNYDMKFELCDLNETFPNDMLKNKIVFTSGCLEQCKNIMNNALHNIINSHPKLIINFEVDYDASDFIVRKYLDALDYQNNLVRNLKKLEKDGRIKIISINKMRYSLSPVNRSSIIIWKPIK